MDLHYHLLDVFTDRAFGGNPLAVFPDATAIDAATMQQVAAELGLSESAFVLPARRAGAAWRLRIFTPRIELPFAGHPTLGAARLLADLGMAPRHGAESRFTLEEETGLVEVSVRDRSGSEPFAELAAPEPPVRGPEPPPASSLAEMLGLDETDLADQPARPEAYSAGVPFLYIPLRSRSALARVQVDLGQWRTLASGWWAPHVYVYCREPEDSRADIRARMFAPGMGITEDPATGAAAAAFAGVLEAGSPPGDGTLAWTVEQGVEMGRPSLLRIEADRAGGRLVAVRVGGASVRVGEGTLRLQ